MNVNVWECGDNLGLWWEIGAFLKFEITDSPRQRKVAINSAKIDKTACGLYPSLFTYIFTASILITCSSVDGSQPSFCGL